MLVAMAQHLNINYAIKWAVNRGRSSSLRVAISWSGGKDSCLAYLKAVQLGFSISCLVTFLWEKPSLAHPLSIIELQAKASGTRLYKARVREPYFEQYRQAIRDLVKENNIEAIIVGDIAPLDAFHGNWMENVCQGLGIRVLKPLWEIERRKLLEDLISSHCKVVFSCVKKPWFSESWVGRELDWESLGELEKLSREYGIDLSGENGEYHTLVLDAPFFKETIKISRYSIDSHNGSFYMRVEEAFLEPKSS